MWRWRYSRRLGDWRRLFAIAIGVVLLGYVALVLFGGRIPGRSLLLPFAPLWLFWAREWFLQVRDGSAGWGRRPALIPQTAAGIVAYALCFAIVAGVVVRYYLH